MRFRGTWWYLFTDLLPVTTSEDKRYYYYCINDIILFWHIKLFQKKFSRYNVRRRRCHPTALFGKVVHWIVKAWITNQISISLCDITAQPYLSGGLDKAPLQISWWYAVTSNIEYRRTSNIRRTPSDNQIVDHSDVVGASPVGAAPTTSSFST